MDKNKDSGDEKDVPNHPCHRLSVPLAKLFWCRHCMQTFTDPISRWRHSKECKMETFDKHTKRKSKEAHALQLFAHTSAIAESQLRPRSTTHRPRKVPRIDPPDSCDLKCFICHRIFASLHEMREHVKTPCHRPAFEEEYIEEEADLIQTSEPRMIIMKDGEVIQQAVEAVTSMESLVSQDQLQNLHAEVNRNTEWMNPMELLARASRVQSTTESAIAAQSIAQDSRNSQLQQTVMRVERNLNSNTLNDNFPMELLVQATEMLQPNASGTAAARGHTATPSSLLSSEELAVKVEPVPGNVQQNSGDDKLPMELLVQASELMQTGSSHMYTTIATTSASATAEVAAHGSVANVHVAGTSRAGVEEANSQKTCYQLSEATQEEEGAEANARGSPSTSFHEQSIYITQPDGTRERIVIQSASGEEVVEEEEFTIDPSSAQTVAIPVDSDGNPIKLENMELLTEGEDGSGQEIVYVVVM